MVIALVRELVSFLAKELFFFRGTPNPFILYKSMKLSISYF